MDRIPDPAPQSITGTGLHSRRISTWNSQVRWLLAPRSIFTQPPIPRFSPACYWLRSAPSTTTLRRFSAPVIGRGDKNLGRPGIQFLQRLGEKPPHKGEPPLSPP